MDRQLLIRAVKLILQYLVAGEKKPKKTTRTNNREHLFATACKYIGTDASPNDVAPDEYGCAESVSDIFNKAFDEELGGDVSTYRMWRAIKDDPRFTLVDDPEAGDIIISPTGYRTRKPE